MSGLYDVSRSVVVVRKEDGNLCYLRNSEIEFMGDVTWTDIKGKVLYKMTIPQTDFDNKYRALHWSNSYSGEKSSLEKRIVPWNIHERVKVESSSSEEGGLTPETFFYKVRPVYETIQPSSYKAATQLGLSIVFWSNLKVGISQDGVSTYVSEKVYLIKGNNYDEALEAGLSQKILCRANIIFMPLKQTGGGITDTKFLLFPVVDSISVITAENTPVFDFAGGGTGVGGSVGRHHHGDNSVNNGGFSYSVFAPGTTLNPISWY